MGTRHLILVFYKGAYRIAQYGQWDGYPSSQGVVVLAFVQDAANLAKLKAALDTPGRIFTPTNAMLKEYDVYMERQQLEHSRQNPMSDRPEPLYPSLSRDTGAKILQLVADATAPIPIVTGVEFIADTLFCEWAYVVDLDAETLEVYAGMRPGKGQSRFGELEGVKDVAGPNLMGSWVLDKLPDEGDFLRTFEASEDEDE